MQSLLARNLMVGQQVRTWDVLNPDVLNVMAELDREDFLPPQWRSAAYADAQLPIGEGQFTLTPKLEGRLLQALEITSGDKILEIGSGCGYLTAALARLGASVESIEINETLCEFARENLARNKVTNAKIIAGDASDMSPGTQRFDVIAVGGSLARNAALLERRLSVGGRLFAVYGQGTNMHATRVVRASEDSFQREQLFETVLAPLAGFEALETFVF